MNIATQSQSSSDEHWCGFAVSLRLHCDSDYIALRLLAYTEPNAVTPTMYRMMIEVIEKSLKFFITVKRKSDSAFTEAKDFGYNIQGLLSGASQYESTFNDPDVKRVSTWFGDKKGKFLHHLRYGSGDTHSNPRTADLQEELSSVDKIFINSMLLLPKLDGDFFLGGSLLRSLVANTFPGQYPNRELTLSALKRNNTYFEALSTRCVQFEQETKNLLQKAQDGLMGGRVASNTQ